METGQQAAGRCQSIASCMPHVRTPWPRSFVLHQIALYRGDQHRRPLHHRRFPPELGGVFPAKPPSMPSRKAAMIRDEAGCDRKPQTFWTATSSLQEHAGGAMNVVDNNFKNEPSAAEPCRLDPLLVSSARWRYSGIIVMWHWTNDRGVHTLTAIVDSSTQHSVPYSMAQVSSCGNSASRVRAGVWLHAAPAPRNGTGCMRSPLRWARQPLFTG